MRCYSNSYTCVAQLPEKLVPQPRCLVMRLHVHLRVNRAGLKPLSNTISLGHYSRNSDLCAQVSG
jgi:hypothetical protein